MRIFLDDQGQGAHFRLVARRAADEALVYTEPAMVKLIAHLKEGQIKWCVWTVAG